MLLSFLLLPTFILLGLSQGVCSCKQLGSDPSVSSFFSASCGGDISNGSGSGAKPGTLGNGIKELRLGAGAAGIRRAIGHIEALPVLFGSRGCSAVSGLFSFSVGSMYLTKPSIG